MNIKNLEPKHWSEVKKIYEFGIATGFSTFETAAPSWEIWDRDHLPHSRLVCEIDGKITGWVALMPVSKRSVYQGVAESSIYIDPEFQGMGIGFVLLNHILKESEANGIWILQAAIFENNKASIRLHEKSGYRNVGYREHIGQLKGVWHHLLLFEKRSKTVGI